MNEILVTYPPLNGIDICKHANFVLTTVMALQLSVMKVLQTVCIF